MVKKPEHKQCGKHCERASIKRVPPANKTNSSPNHASDKYKKGNKSKNSELSRDSKIDVMNRLTLPQERKSTVGIKTPIN